MSGLGQKIFVEGVKLQVVREVDGAAVEVDEDHVEKVAPLQKTMSSVEI